MLNIIMPLGIQSTFFEGSNYPFPMPLVEIRGKPMIQNVIENLSLISSEKCFIFILRDEDCLRYHLDSTIRLLVGDNCVIIKLATPTMGAPCSAMLAIEHIDNDDPILIVNGDQILDVDLDEYLAQFQIMQADAGCLIFNSVHPRWSYVRLEDKDNIIETAVKHPISKNAIAGLYYFAHGSDFILAAQRTIGKGACIDDVYYVASVLNEMVLMNRRLKALSMPDNSYHTFYSPKKIEEFEMRSNRLPKVRSADIN